MGALGVVSAEARTLSRVGLTLWTLVDGMHLIVLVI